MNVAIHSAQTAAIANEHALSADFAADTAAVVSALLDNPHLSRASQEEGQVRESQSGGDNRDPEQAVALAAAAALAASANINAAAAMAIETSLRV